MCNASDTCNHSVIDALLCYILTTPRGSIIVTGSSIPFFVVGKGQVIAHIGNCCRRSRRFFHNVSAVIAIGWPMIRAQVYGEPVQERGSSNRFVHVCVCVGGCLYFGAWRMQDVRGGL